MNDTLSRALRPRTVRFIVAATLLLTMWWFARRALAPGIPDPDALTLAHVQNVRILRDGLGVPHVFGRTDADAAFGLAYAHAEDDYPLIQAVAAASRGRLGLVLLSVDSIVNDYYAALIDVEGQVARDYEKLSPDYRAVLEGYARGLNYYAYKHPEEVRTVLLPFRGRDLAAGFAHKIPYMADLPGMLKLLLSKQSPRNVGDRTVALGPVAFPGSNAHAVSAFRSTDNTTRLNVNSHQPYEGPVAWYEAHIVSGEGWNAAGGLFPGAPIVLHGHNQHLGWAHTVNKPDIIDVYKLTVNAEGTHYQLDGQWLPLERRSAGLRLDVGFFTLPIPRDVLASRHGPVLKTDYGYFAIRYSGIGRAMHAGEQWYRMNKARNLDEWLRAMETQGIPMFNTVYADRSHILYVYNALLPKRVPGLDYSKVLPGDRSDLIWSQYVPLRSLPMVKNPSSGFVQNCNTSPFLTTTGTGNPKASDFPREHGIESLQNNRGLRSLRLFGSGERISREVFLRYKWDRTYDPAGPMYKLAIEPLRDYRPAGPDEAKALELLRAWDGKAEEKSPGAIIGIYMLQALSTEIRRQEFAHLKTPVDAFREAVAFLKKNFGRVDVPLSEVQRLQRGTLDIGLGGGTDLLNCVHSAPRRGRMVATAGDSYVMLVEFGSFGVRSFSRHQYGNSSRPTSPHYTDQARAFADRTLRPLPLTEKEILAESGARAYHPGQESKYP